MQKNNPSGALDEPKAAMVERVAEAIFLSSGRAMDVAWSDADKVLTILRPEGPVSVRDHFRAIAEKAIEASGVPALLEALKAARDHVAACWDDGDAEYADEIKADLDKIDAAIALTEEG